MKEERGEGRSFVLRCICPYFSVTPSHEPFIFEPPKKKMFFLLLPGVFIVIT